MTVVITLTTAGTNTGPFNLYSNVDGYTSAFATGVSKSALLAGYTSTVVPSGATIVRALSTGTDCNGSYVDMSISGLPTSYQYRVSAISQPNASDACEFLSNTLVKYAAQDSAEAVTFFYTDALLTIPFIGDGGYYKFRLNTVSANYSGIINSSGAVSVISPC